MRELDLAAKKSILKKLENLEAYAQLILETATAVRKELQGGSCNSPQKGKNKAAISTVLANRRKHINKGNNDSKSNH